MNPDTKAAIAALRKSLSSPSLEGRLTGRTGATRPSGGRNGDDEIPRFKNGDPKKRDPVSGNWVTDVERLAIEKFDLERFGDQFYLDRLSADDRKLFLSAVLAEEKRQKAAREKEISEAFFTDLGFTLDDAAKADLQGFFEAHQTEIRARQQVATIDAQIAQAVAQAEARKAAILSSIEKPEPKPAKA